MWGSLKMSIKTMLNNFDFSIIEIAFILLLKFDTYQNIELRNRNSLHKHFQKPCENTLQN